jgi:hypothetical protein
MIFIPQRLLNLLFGLAKLFCQTHTLLRAGLLNKKSM